MINETSVRCFLTLTKTMSFTEAAKQLYMTQQSVSKYIAKLEEDLGYRLFQRSPHSVSLTQAGECFRHAFSESERLIEQARELAGSYLEEKFRYLSIGYLEGLEISSEIGEAVAKLQKAMPQVQLVGEKQPHYELNAKFMQREIDLIITYSEFTPQISGVKSAKVMDTSLVLLASPDNPLATESAVYSDFSREVFIKSAAAPETLSESRSRALKQCRELGFTPSDIIITPNIETAYMATELGQGVMISTMLSRVTRQSNLRIYPIGQMERLLCFWMEDQENPAAAMFAGFLSE